MADPRDEEIRQLRQSLIATNQMIVAIAYRLEQAGLAGRLELELSNSALAILDPDVRLHFEKDFRRIGAA